MNLESMHGHNIISKWEQVVIVHDNENLGNVNRNGRGRFGFPRMTPLTAWTECKNSPSARSSWWRFERQDLSHNRNVTEMTWLMFFFRNWDWDLQSRWNTKNNFLVSSTMVTKLKTSHWQVVDRQDFRKPCWPAEVKFRGKRNSNICRSNIHLLTPKAMGQGWWGVGYKIRGWKIFICLEVDRCLLLRLKYAKLGEMLNRLISAVVISLLLLWRSVAELHLWPGLDDGFNFRSMLTMTDLRFEVSRHVRKGARQSWFVIDIEKMDLKHMW